MGKQEVLENALQICKGLTGVREAFLLDDNVRKAMLDEEATVMGAGNTAVDNQGVKEAFTRQYIIGIVKDPRFRPPPEPTILMMCDDVVVGKEIFPWTMNEVEGNENVIWLSDGFVVFTDRIQEKPAKFVMPPVSFPEINPSNGCKDVVSCSPAPTTDLLMRKYHGLNDDAKLASVLIGFNLVDDE
ncbi:MAG: hypothetical protein MJZ38_00730 [archaeon]|nr:hypothetical protein [archaeon]